MCTLNGIRILHLQKAKGIGGSERHIIDLCAGLRQLGARPQILWLEQKGHALDGLVTLGNEMGVTARRLPIHGHLDPTAAPRISRWLRANPQDLIHVHLIHATLHGVLAARMAGVHAIVATRHRDDTYQRLPWFRLAARLADRACAAVIAPSEWVAQNAARWDGTPGHKIRVIRHGIDMQRFAACMQRFAPRVDRSKGVRPFDARQRERDRWGAGPQELVIGCVARLHPSKDHDTLLRAFAALQRRLPSVHLALLGSGPLRSRLESLARDLLGPDKAASRVHFLGERPDVEGVLAAIDIAVVSTHREGFCLAALEAMAAHLPVVATRVGPLPELIRHGQEGLLVKHQDPESMAAALEKIARNALLRRRLASAAGQTARRYSMERMVNETAALYAEVLGSVKLAGSSRSADTA